MSDPRLTNVFDFVLVIGPPRSSDPKLLQFPHRLGNAQRPHEVWSLHWPNQRFSARIFRQPHLIMNGNDHRAHLYQTPSKQGSSSSPLVENPQTQKDSYD